MKIKTSKGLEYTAQWAGESLGKQGRFLVQLPEVRPLVQLVAEFDGIDWMETSGPDGQPVRRMEGPMALFRRVQAEQRPDSDNHGKEVI